jgi:hypothetical protein
MAKKRGRKRTNDLYFGPQQEEAVKEYLSLGKILEFTGDDGKPYYIWTGSTSEQIRRDRIYMEHLYEPLNKMVESIIRKYKLYRKGYDFEDLHADALSFLMMKADKYDGDKNKRAYSYYGTIIKNYLLGLVQKDGKNLKKFTSYDEDFESINERDDLTYTIENDDDVLVELIQDVIGKIQIELDENEESGRKKLNENQRRVGEALIEILTHWDIILDASISENKKYNKLSIYESMRNLTGLNTKDVRKALAHFKDIYYIFKNDYIDNDLM